jgi:hypothetical protein
MATASSTSPLVDHRQHRAEHLLAGHPVRRGHAGKDCGLEPPASVELRALRPTASERHGGALRHGLRDIAFDPGAVPLGYERAAGQPGVERTLANLCAEIERGMKLMGMTSLSKLGRENLRWR